MFNLIYRLMITSRAYTRNGW